MGSDAIEMKYTTKRCDISNVQKITNNVIKT